MIDVAPPLLLICLVILILTGYVTPRRELMAARTFREQLEDEPVRELPVAPMMDGIFTQAAIAATLPPSIATDFDCPDHGPHDFLPGVTSRGNHYEWCRHCNRLKRTVEPWPDTRDPLDVVYSLQFSR